MTEDSNLGADPYSFPRRDLERKNGELGELHGENIFEWRNGTKKHGDN